MLLDLPQGTSCSDGLCQCFTEALSCDCNGLQYESFIHVSQCGGILLRFIAGLTLPSQICWPLVVNVLACLPLRRFQFESCRHQLHFLICFCTKEKRKEMQRPRLATFLRFSDICSLLLLLGIKVRCCVAISNFLQSFYTIEIKKYADKQTLASLKNWPPSASF